MQYFPCLLAGEFSLQVKHPVLGLVAETVVDDFLFHFKSIGHKACGFVSKGFVSGCLLKGAGLSGYRPDVLLSSWAATASSISLVSRFISSVSTRLNAAAIVLRSLSWRRSSLLTGCFSRVCPPAVSISAKSSCSTAYKALSRFSTSRRCTRVSRR